MEWGSERMEVIDTWCFFEDASVFYYRLQNEIFHKQIPII